MTPNGLSELPFALIGQTGFEVIQWTIPILVVGGVVSFLALTGRLRFGSERTDRRPESGGSLETLKRRYAEGAIDDVEFERKLETLIEHETVADAEQSLTDGGSSNSTRNRESSTSASVAESVPERTRPRRTGPQKRGRCATRRNHCK